MKENIQQLHKDVSQQLQEFDFYCEQHKEMGSRHRCLRQCSECSELQLQAEREPKQTDRWKKEIAESAIESAQHLIPEDLSVSATEDGKVKFTPVDNKGEEQKPTWEETWAQMNRPLGPSGYAPMDKEPSPAHRPFVGGVFDYNSDEVEEDEIMVNQIAFFINSVKNGLSTTRCGNAANLIFNNLFIPRLSQLQQQLQEKEAEARRLESKIISQSDVMHKDEKTLESYQATIKQQQEEIERLRGIVESAIDFGINVEAGNIKRDYTITATEQFLRNSH